ncbi:reverse transcriptase family protein [Pseudomonas sp. NPDC089395]|uniref:reverse transcriptase family protein n=1 Tax=Pseudomonas sp. NPDC089395 TaxID=3364460 RepID=UPI00380DACBE
MERWNPQLFRKRASGIDPEVLEHCIAVGKRITALNRYVQPVFTLKHLAVLSGVDYGFIRQTVARRTDAYTEFRVKKRSTQDGDPRYRTICVPSPGLMQVQRWIAQNILAHVPAHVCSVAFSKGNSLYQAAEPHCSAKWLVKLDIRDFFESISEASIYLAIRSCGFESLISFEMARLCTRVVDKGTYEKALLKTKVKQPSPYVIAQYAQAQQGHLPQGAPTSPMLANLVCRQLDERLSAIAEKFDVRYTRYADDMTFSSDDAKFGRDRAQKLIQTVYKLLACQSLSPNTAKTTIVPPSARKIVLGLSVEEAEPRLTRQFKALLRQHIYYLSREDIGVIKHSATRGFTSVTGLRHHLEGLLAFAAQIEPEWAAIYRSRFQSIKWP